MKFEISVTNQSSSLYRYLSNNGDRDPKRIDIDHYLKLLTGCSGSLRFQCGYWKCNMDIAISVRTQGLEHGSLVSKVNPGIPVWILEFLCEFSDYCVHHGFQFGS